MQIFILDYNPTLNAKYHCDKHVIKQVLEACQLLCATMRLHGIDYGYKITHKNHPCRIWLERSKENFYWTKKLGLELAKEYTNRYGKIHKSQSIIEGTYCPDDIPQLGLTPFVQAMPDQYKCNDAVKAYRAYYIGEKYEIAKYAHSERPEWFK